jgi:hypothetical protein
LIRSGFPDTLQPAEIPVFETASFTVRSRLHRQEAVHGRGRSVFSGATKARGMMKPAARIN